MELHDLRISAFHPRGNDEKEYRSLPFRIFSSDEVEIGYNTALEVEMGSQKEIAEDSLAPPSSRTFSSLQNIPVIIC